MKIGLASVEPAALQYYDACPIVPHVYGGARTHVRTCTTRVEGARTRGYSTCPTRVLSAPTADSVTVQANRHYSSSLQYPSTIVYDRLLSTLNMSKPTAEGEDKHGLFKEPPPWSCPLSLRYFRLVTLEREHARVEDAQARERA